MVDYHFFKDIVNRFFGRYVGFDKRPTFFDIAETYPALQAITQKFTAIHREFHQVLQQTPQLPRYHDIDPGEAEISGTTAKDWNVFMVYLLGYRLEKAERLCPELCASLSTIPNLVQAFFSILEPGKSIPKHKGPYLGYLRYHLGIEIPKENAPQIIVNEQAYTWQPGEAVLFDDSWPHEVVNTSSEYRAVLIIDVLRPMPFLPNLVNRLVTQIAGRYFYGRKVVQRALKYDEEIVPLVR